MLKKAGIVVAAAAAGLLAVSPLAFASDTDQSGGYWNSNNNTQQHPTQVCDNHVGIIDGAFALGLKSEASNKQVNSGDCKQENSSEN